MAIFSEDAVYKGSVGDEPGKTFNGRQEIGPAVEGMFSSAGATVLSVLDVYPFDGGATVTWHVGGQDSSGAPVNVLGIDVFKVVENHTTLKDAYTWTP